MPASDFGARGPVDPWTRGPVVPGFGARFFPFLLFPFRVSVAGFPRLAFRVSVFGFPRLHGVFWGRGHRNRCLSIHPSISIIHINQQILDAQTLDPQVSALPDPKSVARAV